MLGTTKAPWEITAEAALRAANKLHGMGVVLRLSVAETATIIERETRLKEKEAAMRAVLMFHSGKPWDYAARHKWFNLTQSSEATTKVVCDMVRAALEGT